MINKIILSEADVQSIINGRAVVKTIADGTKVSVRQNYARDIVAPMINDRFNVRDAVADERAKDSRSLLLIPYFFERR